MTRTLCLLALALLAHVTLVAALANACGPQCGNPFSNQHLKPGFTTNKAIQGSKAAPALRGRSTIATQLAPEPSRVQPASEHLSDHPADLPTNDPPLVAAASGSANRSPVKP